MARKTNPVKTVNKLGAKWSPDFDAYASGRIRADQVRCVLCQHSPCNCPPFGSDAYLALINKVHGRRR
ncbi:hypothetical protein [Actinoplanes subtropicus]|uniref:hypothetical protein n=1 Tax=Actinoplanes subtropicus TaxID=543632 RepID=UPI0004C36B51|nr:hypothetical protein [Actinoplanes subtropicus]